jgi:hypothetical protein
MKIVVDKRMGTFIRRGDNQVYRGKNDHKGIKKN